MCSARHGGPHCYIEAEEKAPSIAPKIKLEDLIGALNYDIPETWAAIEEWIPDETNWGQEILAETVDDDVEVTAPEDTNVQQIYMFATSHERVNQDNSEGSSNDTLDDTTGHWPLDPIVQPLAPVAHNSKINNLASFSGQLSCGSGSF
jgi:hypothetical protein